VANREACELYIEQEIKEKLAQGKKPWSIGKELSSWVEKLFEVTINPHTIKSRAARIAQENDSNESKKSQPVENTTNYETPAIIEKRKPQGGGEREGAGRPRIETVSYAMQFAQMAISQLERIQPEDPKKEEAFKQVINYIDARRENE
jgi:hypothetical protein